MTLLLAVLCVAVFMLVAAVRTMTAERNVWVTFNGKTMTCPVCRREVSRVEVTRDPTTGEMAYYCPHGCGMIRGAKA